MKRWSEAMKRLTVHRFNFKEALNASSLHRFNILLSFKRFIAVNSQEKSSFNALSLLLFKQNHRLTLHRR
jgi:hypothetical protein